MNIVEILPKENYVLHIKSDDGKIGLFDVKPYLDSEVFAQLKDRDEFERIHNGKYFVEWDCGADLSADTIQARWILTPKKNTQQSTSADARAAELVSP